METTDLQQRKGRSKGQWIEDGQGQFNVTWMARAVEVGLTAGLASFPRFDGTHGQVVETTGSRSVQVVKDDWIGDGTNGELTDLVSPVEGQTHGCWVTMSRSTNVHFYSV